MFDMTCVLVCVSSYIHTSSDYHPRGALKVSMRYVHHVNLVAICRINTAWLIVPQLSLIEHNKSKKKKDCVVALHLFMIFRRSLYSLITCE